MPQFLISDGTLINLDQVEYVYHKRKGEVDGLPHPARLTFYFPGNRSVQISGDEAVSEAFSVLKSLTIGKVMIDETERA